jgi:hypothetical protein
MLVSIASMALENVLPFSFVQFFESPWFRRTLGEQRTMDILACVFGDPLDDALSGRLSHTSLFNYMIAVGGAGSSGLPAFASGIRTSTNAIAAITSTPARYDGCAKISGSLPSL